MKRCLIGLLCALAISACDDATEANEATTVAPGLALPTGPVPQRPWARQACAAVGARELLACVDGAAITRSDYERVRRHYPRGVPARQVVSALVAAELLAGRAAAAGLWSDWLLVPYTRALAQAWLVHHFETGYPPEKVPQSDIDRAFRNATVRVRYKRQRSFFVTDAQILCCTGDWKQCTARPDVTDCIERKAPQARALYEVLIADPPASAVEMTARVAVLAQRFPDVASADVSFYYDTSKSYDEQEGYDLMVQPFTEGVVRLQAGEIGEPIRSPFGWHVVRVDRIEEALDGKPSDPHVRADIAANILPLVRKRDLQKLTFARMKKLGVQIHFDRLTR